MSRFTGYLAGFVGAALMFAMVATADAGRISGAGGGGVVGQAANILTELLTVDTDDSGLNADTVDGLEGTSLITTSTTANTTALTMNATGNDVQSASGTALRVYAAGAANLEIGGGNGVVSLLDSSGTARHALLTGTSHQLMMLMNDSNSAIQLTLGGVGAGYRLSGATNDPVFSAAKSLSSDFSRTNIWSVYFNGLRAQNVRQQVTCPAENAGAAATESVSVTSSVVEITNSDTNGCEITLTETDAVIGAEVEFVVVSNAGGVVTLEDAANIVVATTACDTTGMALDGTAQGRYVDASDDHWVINACF